MKIGGWQKLTLIDFPQKLATIVFTLGCNFACPFCFNRDLVLAKRPLMAEKEIFRFLKKRKGLLDGVVVTGGEATLQPDLPRFLKKVKALGFLTMIETNGSNPAVLAQLIKAKLLDFVAIDVKAPLDGRYAKAIGKKKFDPSLIVECIRLMLESGIPFELRTTVVPGIHRKKDLVAMAKQLKTLISKNSREKTPLEGQSQVSNLKWYLQDFQPKTCLNSTFNNSKPYSRKKMTEFLKAAKKHFPGAKLRSA
jgi:pyruvate formate lyase activating enzyme